MTIWQYNSSPQCQDIGIVVQGESSGDISVMPTKSASGAYNDIVLYDTSGQLIIDMPKLCGAGMNKDANLFLNSILEVENKGNDTVFLKLTKKGIKKDAFYFGSIEHGIELEPQSSYTITLEINTCTECEKNKDLLTDITITAN